MEKETGDYLLPKIKCYFVNCVGKCNFAELTCDLYSDKL